MTTCVVDVAVSVNPHLVSWPLLSHTSRPGQLTPNKKSTCISPNYLFPRLARHVLAWFPLSSGLISLRDRSWKCDLIKSLIILWWKDNWGTLSVSPWHRSMFRFTFCHEDCSTNLDWEVICLQEPLRICDKQHLELQLSIRMQSSMKHRTSANW